MKMGTESQNHNVQCGRGKDFRVIAILVLFEYYIKFTIVYRLMYSTTYDGF